MLHLAASVRYAICFCAVSGRLLSPMENERVGSMSFQRFHWLCLRAALARNALALRRRTQLNERKKSLGVCPWENISTGIKSLARAAASQARLSAASAFRAFERMNGTSSNFLS